MCNSSNSKLMNLSHYPSLSTIYPRGQQSKKTNFRVHFIYRKRLSKKQVKANARRVLILNKKMEMKNLKLYMENKSIIEENEKLRQIAALLHLENLALHKQHQINVTR